jgi:cell division protein FtsW (lipid II flippase)
MSLTNNKKDPSDEFYLNIYKYHIDWILRGFFIYFIITGTAFTFILNTEQITYKLLLLVGICIASVLLLLVGGYLKRWLLNLKDKIQELENLKKTELWYLFSMARKVPFLIKVTSITMIVLSIIIMLRVIGLIHPNIF